MLIFCPGLCLWMKWAFFTGGVVEQPKTYLSHLDSPEQDWNPQDAWRKESRLTSAEVTLSSCPHVSSWMCIFSPAINALTASATSHFLWRWAMPYWTKEIEIIWLLNIANLSCYIHTGLRDMGSSDCFHWKIYAKICICAFWASEFTVLLLSNFLS